MAATCSSRASASPASRRTTSRIAGVGRTFQVPRVFRKMSLIDNLLVPVLDARPPTAS